jgi:hypothetical protein
VEPIRPVQNLRLVSHVDKARADWETRKHREMINELVYFHQPTRSQRYTRSDCKAVFPSVKIDLQTRATYSRQPTKMTDASPLCSRCRKPLKENAFALSLEKELPESVPQDLQLCPLCVESFRRWYRKRAKSASSMAPNLEAGDSSASPTASSSMQSRRRHRGKKEMHPAIRIALITSLTVLLFLFTFYWTWTLLNRATRTDE